MLFDNKPPFQLFSGFLSQKEADAVLISIRATTLWNRNFIRIFGKQIPEPRQTAYYSTSGLDYVYSGIRLQAQFPPSNIQMLFDKIEQTFPNKWNSVLLNRYLNGKEYMGWHRDNESSLGVYPIIASLNLGATRDMQFRAYKEKGEVFTLQLQHGDLLIMESDCQEKWEHQIPKRLRVDSERINLTFRTLLY